MNLNAMEVAYLLDSNGKPLTRADLYRIFRIAQERLENDLSGGTTFEMLMNALVEDTINTESALRDAKVLAHISTPDELRKKTYGR